MILYKRATHHARNPKLLAVIIILSRRQSLNYVLGHQPAQAHLEVGRFANVSEGPRRGVLQVHMSLLDDGNDNAHDGRIRA